MVVIALLFSPIKVLAENKKGGESKTLVEYLELKTPNDCGKLNAKRSAELVNGIEINPGDTFSFNQIVGQISKKRGFRCGFITIIQGGKKKTYYDDGSSIWRTSTAIYQAALDLGLEITERHKTYKPCAYAKICDSAVAVWGEGPDSDTYLDMKIKNNKDKQIKFETSVDDNAQIIVKIFETESEKN